jgi:triosephosphate isomerase
MRKTIIAGNWKMNNTRVEAKALTEAVLQGIKGETGLPEIVLCPPFTSLQTVVDLVKGSPIKVGAQNMEYRDSGAYTGEISPLMLKEMGVHYVLIGHSERRQYYGETNQSVNAKVKAALKHGLAPVMCVGETLEQREANKTDALVAAQVKEGLDGIAAGELSSLVVAYEPVWAIGTGKTCETGEAARVIKLIRAELDKLQSGLGEKTSVLYGGSVNAKCIDEQLSQPDIDGGLVGGASLKGDEFTALIKAGQKRQLAASKK